MLSSDHRGVSCSLWKRRAAVRNYRRAFFFAAQGKLTAFASKLKRDHPVYGLERAGRRAVQGRRTAWSTRQSGSLQFPSVSSICFVAETRTAEPNKSLTSGETLAARGSQRLQRRLHVEFLDLPARHAEADLHRALLLKLRDFLIELGHDFCFVGSEYSLLVSGRDSHSTCCSSTAG